MAVSQFTLYQSSDASAPTLSGTAGDLVNLLDKCLVSGYGAKAAAGWTKPYTGANKAAFRNDSSTGTGMYLRVLDDGSGTGGAKEARVTGYESMSDVDTGTAPFPTAAQGISGGAYLICRKSAAASATTRDWIVLADAYTFYLLVLTGDGAGVYECMMFGDIYSVKPSADAYRCALIARSVENDFGNPGYALPRLSAIGSATSGHFMARTYSGAGASVTIGCHGDTAKGGSATDFAGTMVYPNSTDSGLYVSPVWVHETSGNIVRGRLRGLYQPLHAIASFTDKDTLSGANTYSGKSFLLLKSFSTLGVGVFETSNTVETN